MSGQRGRSVRKSSTSALTGGAMLYDASRASNLQRRPGSTRITGKRAARSKARPRGRGTTHLHQRRRQAAFVLRHYRRGGLDRALARATAISGASEDSTRPFAEWQLHYRLHRAGLPVPAPIAARYRAQGLHYTADIITERLPTVRLARRVSAQAGPPILGWITIGRCIRAFHDLGVCHAGSECAQHPAERGRQVYLIDFDRCQLRKPGLWCDGNLVRLRRSLEKITYSLPPERFSEADWHGLLMAIGRPRAISRCTPEAEAPALAHALSLHPRRLPRGAALLRCAAVPRAARSQLLAQFRRALRLRAAAGRAAASGCTRSRWARCRPRAALVSTLVDRYPGIPLVVTTLYAYGRGARAGAVRGSREQCATCRSICRARCAASSIA